MWGGSLDRPAVPGLKTEPTYVFQLSSVPFVQTITRRNLPGDVHDQRLAFPVLDQLRLPKMSVHELFGELDTRIVEHRRVLLQAPIERDRNGPGPRDRLGILNRHFVV